MPSRSASPPIAAVVALALNAGLFVDLAGRAWGQPTGSAGVGGVESAGPPPAPPPPATDSTRESSGPWGTLQSFSVYIAAPDRILALFPVPSGVTQWTFRGFQPDDVTRVLDRPEIPDATRRELLDRSRWVIDETRICVVPSADALLALPPDARGAIYDVLAAWDENEFQASPYFVPQNDVDDWLAGSGMRPQLEQVVARTTYPVGKGLCFSDLPLLVSLTTSHAEARAVLKTLSRTRTVILRLRLDDSADLLRVRDYWSGGAANAKDFLPLLESIATNPSVRHLDIVHLLPPNVRKLLYTFPQPSMAIGGRYPDCHWTSLNFFNERPEQRLFDTAGATMFAVENYRPAEPPYAYGDVLFLTDPQGNAIHSCVYLADDFVFTKNGANVLSPWLIMKLDEVRNRYGRLGQVDVRVYRK